MPEDTNRRSAPGASGEYRPNNAGQRPANAGQRPTGNAPRPAGTVRRPAGSAQGQYGSRPPQGRRPAARRRKKSRGNGLLVAVLCVALVVIALVFVLPRLGKGGDPAPVVPASVTPAADVVAAAVTAAPTVPPAVIQPADDIDVSRLNVNTALDGTWRSILLLGTDARYWDDMEHTDTIVIVCYNTQTGAIRMVSIMRDTFIDTESNGTVRVNTLKNEGGAQLLISTLNAKLGLNITEYMKVNFDGFRNLIDLLGGIDIDITQTEMEYINSSLEQQVNLLVDKRYRETAMQENTLTTYGPATHLNGLQALAYARIRKSDSDFKRTERQRTVIVTAVQKAIDTVTIVQMTQMATTMMQYVETNLSLNSLYTLGLSVISNGLDDIQDMYLPVNNSYVGETRGKTWGMYDVDWPVNRTAMQSLLNGY